MKPSWSALALGSTKIGVITATVGVCAAILIGTGPGHQSAIRHSQPPKPIPLADQELLCPGPETIGIRGASGNPTAPVAVTVKAASAPAAVRAPAARLPESGPLVIAPIAAKEPPKPNSQPLGKIQEQPNSVAQGMRVRGTGPQAVGLIAEQSSTLKAGDLRGLTSVACSAPRHDTWLVGGGGEPGRRGRLVIANPQAVTAQVTVDVWSATGLMPRTAGNTLALGPHSRTVLLLDALAPQVRAPVVRVRSSGAAVAVTLHDAWLAGTTPRGTDNVSAAQPPARRVYVPGLVVTAAQDQTQLRIAVPGATEAVVQLTLLGPAGPVKLPDSGVFRVQAGRSREVSLPGLKDPSEAEDSLKPGVYTAVLAADVPVVAGGMSQRQAEGGAADLAWSAGTAALTGLAGITGATSTSLLLAAPGAEPALVQVTRADASGKVMSVEQVQVSPGTTRAEPGVERGSLWVRAERGSGPVVLARRSTPGELLSVSSVLSVPEWERPLELVPGG